MSQETERDIRKVCDEIHDMLVQKNRSYGDSALSPKGIFFKGDAEQGIRVRLDDKLSRLMGDDPNAYGEDPELDIMGYLVLLRICKLRKNISLLKTLAVENAPAIPDLERERTRKREKASLLNTPSVAQEDAPEIPDIEKERRFRRMAGIASSDGPGEAE